MTVETMEIKYVGFLYIKNTDFKTALDIVTELDGSVNSAEDRTAECQENAFDTVIYLDVELQDIDEVDTDKVVETIERMLLESAKDLGVLTDIMEFEAENYFIEAV